MQSKETWGRVPAPARRKRFEPIFAGERDNDKGQGEILEPWANGKEEGDITVKRGKAAPQTLYPLEPNEGAHVGIRDGIWHSRRAFL